MAEFEPIIINVPKPPSRFHLPSFLVGDSVRTTKIVAAVSTIVISVSMIGFVGFTALTNSKKFKEAHNITSPGDAARPVLTSGGEKSANALPGGDTIVGTSINTGTNSPVVTLSATPSSVTLGKKSHLKWSVTNNPTSCVASEDWSGNKNSSGEEDTPVLSKAQNYIFTLTCKTATGTGFSTVTIGTIQQTIVGNPQTSPVVTIASSKPSVFVGYTALLSWNVTNSPSSCTASGDWSGAKSTNPTGSETTVPLTSVKTYSFTLSCSNSAGSSKATTQIDVVNPPPDVPITVLTSDTASPSTAGVRPVLSWSVTNSPTYCTASGDWSGAKSLAGGNETVGPLNTLKSYSFVLTCGNASGSTVAPVTMLIVPSRPIVSLSVSSTFQYVGGTATVSWSATNSPTKCTMSGDLGWTKTNTSSGTDVINLTTPKTYLFSLTCINDGGSGIQEAQLGVTVPQSPQVNVSVSPISITAGQSATVAWTSTNNPTSCTGSGTGGLTGSLAFNSSKPFTFASAGIYTFIVTCNNANSTAGSGQTSLTVSASGGGVVLPVVTIGFSPTSIGVGSNGSLTWSSTGPPTSCTASNTAGSSQWTGTKSAAGNTSITGLAAGTYTFSLFCANSAGTGATKNATITVLAVPQSTISVSPNPITAGGTTTVTWSGSNGATACTASGSAPWSGAKAGSGTQVLTLTTATTYSFTVQCSNSAGTGPLSNPATVTVNPASASYCVVNSVPRVPCYGKASLAAHVVVGNCWAWIANATNGNWVIDITNYFPHHKGGQSAGTFEDPGSVCNHDITAILKGSVAIPGYRDSKNSTTHSHSSDTYNNTSNSTFYNSSYNKGYYDPANPN